MYYEDRKVMATEMVAHLEKAISQPVTCSYDVKFSPHNICIYIRPADCDYFYSNDLLKEIMHQVTANNAYWQIDHDSEGVYVTLDYYVD